MYGDLFDDLIKGIFSFDKDSFIFDSPIKRVYEAYKIDENTALMTLNLLGIRPEDINVNIETVKGVQVLKVSGITENKLINRKYNYSNELTVSSNRREVESFDWDSRDGVLYIVLKYKELPKVKQIKSSGNKNLLEDLEKLMSKEKEEIKE
jgi:uncharacterized membrane-anchored protein YitT (DUF2179 family)